MPSSFLKTNRSLFNLWPLVLLMSLSSPPLPLSPIFFNPPSHCLTLQRKSDGRKKRRGGGGGWRGLASRRRPLPQGLPHPSFRSHPSHLFLSVFRYLYCTLFPSLSLWHSYLQRNSPAQLTRNAAAHENNSNVRSRTILRPGRAILTGLIFDFRCYHGLLAMLHFCNLALYSQLPCA